MSIIPSSRAYLDCGPRVALIGDSMQDTAFLSTATVKSYRNYAMPTWVRFLTKQRVSIPFNLNFAVSGDTLEQISVRAPLVVAAAPDLCIFNGGTNNLIVVGQTFAEMKRVFYSNILAPILAAKIPVIITPITPRPGLTTAQIQLMNNFNDFLRDLCYGENNAIRLAGLNPMFRSSMLRFADPTPYMVDYASATGEPLANMIRDTVHTNANGAYWYGKAVADVINDMLPTLGTQINHPGDAYNAATNPSGNILRSALLNRGILAGTGGTSTASAGFSFIGTNVANDFTVRRTAGTSTMTCDATKQNPRLDGPNSGERQRLIFAGSTTGLALETCQFRFTPTFAIPAGDIQNGDTVFAEVALQVVSAVNVLSIELGLVSFGGAGMNAFDGLVDNPGSALYPNQAISGILRTAPIVIPVGDTGMTWAVNVNFKTDVAAASAEFFLADASLRKVV